MFARNESKDTQEFIFEIAPIGVANACIDVLKQVGLVKSVSKESGIISGEVSNGIVNPSIVTIRISQDNDNNTHVLIKMIRREGWLTSQNGAQENMAKFSELLYKHPNIFGKVKTGW